MAVNFIFKKHTYPCPVELTLGTLKGKWKVLILWNLRKEPHRYSGLKKKLPKVSHKMLSEKLKELEEDGFIYREVFPEVPPKTEYSLTDEGRTILPVLSAMQQWGMRYKQP